MKENRLRKIQKLEAINNIWNKVKRKKPFKCPGLNVKSIRTKQLKAEVRIAEGYIYNIAETKLIITKMVNNGKGVKHKKYGDTIDSSTY